MNKTTLALMSLFLGASVRADALYVGTKETLRVAVASGTDTRAPAFVDVDGRIDKVGAGTLELPLAGIWQNGSFSVVLREGVLSLTDAVAPAWETPTATLEKAAFWVHAGCGLVVSNDTFVYEWSDVRDGSETPVAYDSENPVSGRSHPYAQARWDLGMPENRFFGIAPSLVQRQAGPALYFNGYGASNSSQYMRWMNADGTEADITDVTDIFAVIDCVETFGQFISPPNDPNDLQFGATREMKGAAYAAATGDAAKALLDGAILCRNGKRISLWSSVPTGLQVLDYQFPYGRKPHLGAFFAERPDKVTGPGAVLSGRCGGDYLSEVLVFTNRLTAAERMQVQQYLLRKWGCSYAKPSVEVTPGDSAEVRADVSDGAFANGLESITIAGDAALVKSGTGTVESGLDGAFPRFAIEGGTLHARKPETVELAAGTAATAAVPAWKADWSSGTDLSVTSGGSADAVTKDGNGRLDVDRIASGIRKLDVTAGTLALGLRPPADAAVLDPAYPTNVVSVAVTNAGFESATGVMKSSGINYILPRQKTPVESLGWWGKQNADFTSQNPGVGFCSTKLTRDDTSGSNWPTGGYEAPEGEWVLCLKCDASAWTFFEVEESGYYNLSFQTCARESYSHGQNNLVDVYMGCVEDAVTDPETSALTKVMTVAPTSDNGFVANNCGVIWLEAGRNVLYFQAVTYNTDRVSNFDDIRLTRVVQSGSVPYGDFECTLGSKPSKTTRTTQAAGWTLETTDVFPDSEQYTSIQVCLADSRADTRPRFYPAEEMLYGDKGLLFLSTGGVAKTTFTPAAGRWRLSCRARRFSYTSSPVKGGSGCFSAPHWRAVLKANDVTVADLGEVEQNSSFMAKVTWPTSFVSDGETALTLVLWQAKGLTGSDHGVGVLDDLELVAASEDPEIGDELVQNGSFEEETNWAYELYTDTNPSCKSLRQVYPGGTLWGANTGYDGNYTWRVTQNGAVHQDVTIPEDGIYRLSFRGLSRHDAKGHGFNPIRAWLYDPANAVTNEIGCAKIASTNFCGHAFTFRAAAGSYQLWLQGDVDVTKPEYPAGSNSDRSSLVDCVSLVRMYYLEGNAPSVPEDLELRVAEGASLALDFGGRITLGRLKLGGRGVNGEISRAKRPDLAAYLTGPGEIFVKPRGFMMIFR